MLELAQGDASRLDLKLARAALGEMAEAFQMFAPYRDVRKVTVFGSARTEPSDRTYELARELAGRFAAGGLDGRHRGRAGHHGRRQRGRRTRRWRSA